MQRERQSALGAAAWARCRVPTGAPQLLVIQDVAAIKDEGGLDHAIIDGLVVVALEAVPLGEDADAVGVTSRIDGVLHARELET